MQIFIQESVIDADSCCSTAELYDTVGAVLALPPASFSLWMGSGSRSPLRNSANQPLEDTGIEHGDTLTVKMGIRGGIDFQHREGSKIGSGGQLSEAQAAIDRRERLRKLALETIDITKDPYFMRNHLGSFECKLCLTLHPNEGNYLAHTQGKRHQSNLGRRAAMEAKNAAPVQLVAKEVIKKHIIKIGRPGYKVTKSRDLHTRQRSLTFEVEYPEAAAGEQPRHRFMSSFEQKVEPADKNYQYLLFACEPYETVAFKIPNKPIDKSEGRFYTNWDDSGKKFAVQLYFLEESTGPPGPGGLVDGGGSSLALS
jgi:splicing factor 3A subunit 2